MKKPAVGQRVRDDAGEGIVELVLSAQFTYKTDDGERHFCMLADYWEIINGEVPPSS